MLGAFMVALLCGGCGQSQEANTAAGHQAQKQDWIQPTPPERAEELRHRLMYGQADH